MRLSCLWKCSGATIAGNSSSLTLKSPPPGYEFSRLRLTASVGSTVVWTNRTAVTQVVQLNDRVIRLAPGGNDGATALTRFSEPGQIVGRLRSNGAASITFFFTEEFKL